MVHLRSIVALLLCVFVFAGGRGTAVAAAPDTSNTIISSLMLDDADVRDALKQLFKLAEVTNYSIATSIQGVVTLSVKNQPFETCLRNILAQVHATYRVEGSVYIIIPKRDDSVDQVSIADAFLSRNIESFVAKDRDVRECLAELLEGASYVIDSNVQGRVTATLANISAGVALREILKDLGATWEDEGGTILIRSGARVVEGRATLRLKQAPLTTAIGALFATANRSFFIGAIKERLVTVDFLDVPFDKAARILAKEAGIEMVKEGDVYIFRERPTKSPAPRSATPSPVWQGP